MRSRSAKAGRRATTRHGTRHHRRWCEDGLDLLAIEPDVFENFVS
jgi:hypothetical protein